MGDYGLLMRMITGVPDLRSGRFSSFSVRCIYFSDKCAILIVVVEISNNSIFID